ncbi:MAG TPA: DEAD/DEAH box helicase family protein [Ignavibacteriaceae bacterium]|jgi:type I restriction enzyme R subunit|nr:MAG: Type-1 restriction enzyme R protein [Ignavibacteria bacterium ADurb.Bin266]OQY74276.1 MAG: restriction endonuclease [Ignavibacteriales bacterium UTCHB2]HQF42050.1 DEAD/DEAH box helicase family protein [Ignavibacteriaceae bacterium]HQI40054.1 DEAD/DEAH box helicase family protein [Ignavibacteriaceae bacterium]
MDKKSLSERDICTKFITPALKNAGWDIKSQIREEVSYTAGKIFVRGKLVQRGKQKRADYILYYKPHLPIAIIEAKDNNHSVSAGIQQALDYSNDLDIPFVYSSNGYAFFEHDKTNLKKIESELALDNFPSPDELWKRYSKWKGLDQKKEEIITQDYHYDPGRKPRYYQQVAINRVVDAIAEGQNRILLVMATGTGKTYTAFQIIWKLWKAGIKKRILFLADRNILVDQTMTNDFKYFDKKMTKITNRKIDKSFEIYLALYQAVTGTDEWKNIYKQFSQNFFDLIIVDECHRGSAAEDSQWREVLEYFHNAAQIGMTATPRETKYISNIDYFGKPVYTYSLKQGIEDGFLAPYKVIRTYIDKDLSGWKPPEGKLDRYGQEIENRIYNLKDYDRTLVIEPRTQLVAKRISDYLKATDRFSKTIVFCEDIDHADRMRHALINENPDLVLENNKYVIKITGDDATGKAELDNFIDPEEKYPVIATTSKLMSTGVDAQTCKLIVLDKNINSLTEFKQIIGRGTRVREDFGKMYFTIIDFRDATKLFYDPAFDGEAVQIYKPKPTDPILPPDEDTETEEPEVLVDPVPPTLPPPIIDDPEGPRTRVKYYVNDVPVSIVGERVQYYDKEKGLVTVTLKDYSKDVLKKRYRTLNDFLNEWTSAERKDVLIAELLEQGVFMEELQEQVGKDMDEFDLICHVAFDMPPLSRKERAANVKKRNYFAKYGEQARKVLEAILDKYSDEGINVVDDAKDSTKLVDFLKLPPISNIALPLQIIDDFGGKQNYLFAVKELENEIYMEA